MEAIREGNGVQLEFVTEKRVKRVSLLAIICRDAANGET